GFSMLEVLVALAIISITGVATISLALQLSKGNDRRQAHLIAHALAASTLDQIVAERARSAPVTTYAPPFDAFRHRSTVRPRTGGVDYTVSVEWAGGRVLIGRL